MKIKTILLTSILLSQVAPVWAFNPDDLEARNGAPRRNEGIPQRNQPLPARGPGAVAELGNAKRHMENAVDQTLAEAQRQAPRFHHNKVFVIGKTGHGKSTFLHAVAGVPLEATENDNGIDFDLAPLPGRALPGLRIGAGVEVGTVEPGHIISEARQAVFIDYLGFDDPRGPIPDIANAVGLKRLFAQGTNSKILLVIEQSALLNRREVSVPTLLNQLAETFPDDDILRNSVSLVITKAAQNYRPAADLGRWRNHVQLGERARILIDAFLQPDRIFKFLAPIAEGRYDGFNNDDFARVLGANQFTLNPRVTPVLNNAARLLISDTVDELREEGRRFLAGTASDRLQTIADNRVSDRTNPNRTIGDLRANLGTLRQDIINIQTMAHFKDNLHRLIGDNAVSGHRAANQPNLVDGFTQNIEFLQTLHPGVNTPVDAWRAALTSIATSIENLAAIPTIIEANGILSIKGRLLSIQDLADAKQRYRNATLAKMYASHTIFADTNITQENLSVALYSPKLIVMKPTIINLSGRNGGNGNNGPAGQGGQNGTHGTPAAHFFANIREATNLANLTIHAKGGNGGNGGQGGHGLHGADGNLNQATNHAREIGLLPYGWGCTHDGGHVAEGHFIRSDDLRHQLALKYTQVLYQAQGTRGSNGGNGGHGGQGAPGGTVRIVGVVWVPSPQNVSAGIPGAHGAGGNAGYNGRDCVGEELIGRHLVYQALVGKNGFLGLGTGRYEDRSISLRDQTLSAKRHVGGGTTNAGNRPNAPHGNAPQAIRAIDDRALNAEYEAFHTGELNNPDTRRFVRNFPRL